MLDTLVCLPCLGYNKPAPGYTNRLDEPDVAAWMYCSFELSEMTQTILDLARVQLYECDSTNFTFPFFNVPRSSKYIFHESAPGWVVYSAERMLWMSETSLSTVLISGTLNPKRAFYSSFPHPASTNFIELFMPMHGHAWPCIVLV